MRRTERLEKSKGIVEQVRLLAWNGKHAQAIALASQELNDLNLSVSVQIDVLEQRVESYIAQGKLDLALKDAIAMTKLAGTDVLKSQALNSKALVQMRLGELKGALNASTIALKLAERSRKKTLWVQVY